jgi:hypothetical protein
MVITSTRLPDDETSDADDLVYVHGDGSNPGLIVGDSPRRLLRRRLKANWFVR